MAYVDLNTIHNPATGTVPPASWGDQVRDNFEYLIQQPRVSVYASASQSVPNSSDTALTANTENYDTDSMHAGSGSRITFTTAGVYIVLASVAYDASAAARVLTRFQIDGTDLYPCDSRAAIGGATPDQVSITRTFAVSAAQYIEVIANQNSGGDLDVDLQEFAAYRIGR